MIIYFQILLEDSQGGISLISTLPQEQGNMPERDVICMENNDRSNTKYRCSH
jgi:hypothetical protein